MTARKCEITRCDDCPLEKWDATKSQLEAQAGETTILETPQEPTP